MARLKIQDALAVKNRKYGEVELPELGGSLRVASLSAAKSLEAAELNAAKARGDDVNAKLMRLLIRGGVVDDNGDQLFASDAELEKFLDRISIDTMNLIVGGITGLMEKPKDAKANAVP